MPLNYDNIYYAVKDPLVEYRLRLLKKEKALYNKVIRQLDVLRRELAAELLLYNESDKRKFLGILLALISTSFNKIYKLSDAEIKKLAVDNASKIDAIMTRAAKPLDLKLGGLEKSAIEEIYKSTAKGYLLATSLGALEVRVKEDIKALHRQMRSDEILPEEAAKTVSEKIKPIKRAASIVVANHVTKVFNKTNIAYGELNYPTLRFVKFVAILDSRTSDICRGFNGTVWDLIADKGRIPIPKLHPNCRSELMPIFDLNLELSTLRPELQAYAKTQVDETETFAEWKKRTGFTSNA